jgi:hypothetical protein
VALDVTVVDVLSELVAVSEITWAPSFGRAERILPSSNRHRSSIPATIVFGVGS